MGWLMERPFHVGRRLDHTLGIQSAYGLLWDATQKRLYIADKIAGQVVSIPLKFRSGIPFFEQNNGSDAEANSCRMSGPTGIATDESTGGLLISAAHAGAIYRCPRDLSSKTLLAGTNDGQTPRIAGYEATIPATRMHLQSLNHPTKVISIRNGRILFIERGFQCLRSLSENSGISSVFSSSSREHLSPLWQPPPKIDITDYNPAFPTDLCVDVHGTIYLSDASHHCVWSLPRDHFVMTRVYYNPSNERGGPGALYLDGSILWIFDYNGPHIVGLDISQAKVREVNRISMPESFISLGCRRNEGTGMTGIPSETGVFSHG